MLNPAGDEDVRHKNTIVPETQALERQPMQIFGKHFPTYFYTNFLVKYPTVLCALFAFIPMLLTILSISVNPTVERGISSFTIRDHTAAKSFATENDAVSKWRNSYDAYLIQKASNQLGGIPEAAGDRSEQKYRIFVNYRVNPEKLKQKLGANVPVDVLRDAANLLNEDNIEYMRTIEKSLQGVQDYKGLCWRSPFRAGETTQNLITLPTCTPLTSVLTYFYIGLFMNSSRLWEFDGVSGQMQKPHHKVLDRIFTNPRYRWFMDQSANAESRRTSLLRTQVTLGWPARSSVGGAINSEADYNDRADEMVSKLVNMIDDVEEHDYIEVTIGGDRLFEGIVLNALRDDAVYVTLSLLVVFVVLWYHCHSFILGLLALLQIAMTYPAGFFLYVACSGTETISLLSSLSLYVAMIIAVDAMMIWFDTFNHSGFMNTSGRKNTMTIAQRAAYTFRKAGVGITVSSLVSFVAFMINLTSSVPAIRTFSGLMATLVVMNWFLMMTFFPSAVLFHHFHISGRRRNLQRQKEILLNRGQRSRFPPQVTFHEELEGIAKKYNVTTYSEAKNFMNAELEAEIVDRKKERGFLEKLGVSNPVRLPNPFKKHNAVEVEFADPSRSEPTQKEAAIFMDQFADAVPDGKGGVSISNNGNDVHSIEPEGTVQISNYNCDEMLAFDDTKLRHRLMETGHRNASDFRPDQLVSIAPFMGIQPTSERAEWRIPNVARMAIFLLFGVARTLQMHPTMKKAPPPPAEGEEAAAAATAAGVQSKPSRYDFLGRMSNWYSERKAVNRKWCCGMFGQRVGESDEQKEERIMKKRVKHQGYSRMETFFFNYYAPFVHRLRVPLSLLGALILAGSIICTGFLEYSNDPPQFLATNPLDKYEEVEKQFAEDGDCDYCSAFFRPRSEFPVADFEAIQTCARELPPLGLGGQMMHAWQDDCGVCQGNNACIDCAGVKNGPARFDRCNQCLQPDDFRFDQCSRCTWNTRNRPECTYCYQKGRGANLNGQGCSVYCDPKVNCLPAHGVCNPVTGQCDCHHDFVNGFRKNNPILIDATDPYKSRFCTSCLFRQVDGSSMVDANCTHECNSPAEEDGSCACDMSTNRCTRCNPERMGHFCHQANKNVCNTDNAYIGAGYCACDAGWTDGYACKYHRDCSYHGIKYSAAEVPPNFGTCSCTGQFRGPTCKLCQCFNGGRCDYDGNCICSGIWEGVDCSSCPARCSAHSVCPRPWTPSMYSIEQCRVLFCNSEELATKTENSTSCRRCSNHSAHLIDSPCNGNSVSNCSGNNDGVYECVLDPVTSICVPNITLPHHVENVNCTCKGAYTGEFCEECQLPPGMTNTSGVRCQRSDGVLLGCDNLPPVEGVLKVFDSCNFCGGSGLCAGCDGIPGSDKKLDSCGICGGPGGCNADGTSTVTPTATVSFMFGLTEDGQRDSNFDYDNPLLQNHMYQVCSQFLERDDIIKKSQSTCVWFDFINWVRESGKSTFPIPEGRVDALAFEYIQTNGTGRLPEMGFEFVVGQDGVMKQRLLYVRFSFRTTDVYPYDSFNEMRPKYDYWKKVLANLNNKAYSGSDAKAIMSSETWVRYFTQMAASKGSVFSLTIAGTVFVFAMLSISCSLTLTVIATLILVSCVLSVLAMFLFLGWKIGAVEQVAMTFLLGASSEQIVHMTEGYLEYLHASQSHMFARDTTALQAVKGMLQRTGVSLTVSSITIVVCSSFLFAAKLVIFKKVAGILIIVILTTLVHSVLIYSAVLCVGGPVTSFRNKKTMGFFGLIGAVLCIVVCCIVVFTGVVAVE